MKIILPFLLVLLSAHALQTRIFVPSFLQQDEIIEELVIEDMTDKEEDAMASEETIDLFEGLFEGISTDLAEGESYTAEVPEEFQDDLALVEATAEVDDMLQDFVGATIKTEDDFYIGVDAVSGIVDELDGDEYVFLKDDVFNHDELAQAIVDANELHEASMMNEGINDLEELWDEIEETGEVTEENLEAQVVAVNQILNYMEEDEVILLDGMEYTYDEVEELAEDIEEELEDFDSDEE